MNTNNKQQDQAQPRQMDQQKQKQRSEEPGEKAHKLHGDQKHEHELPETRLTR